MVVQFFHMYFPVTNNGYKEGIKKRRGAKQKWGREIRSSVSYAGATSSTLVSRRNIIVDISMNWVSSPLEEEVVVVVVVEELAGWLEEEKKKKKSTTVVVVTA